MSNTFPFGNDSKKAERRSSSATTMASSASSSKENKRPLTAVMSEERVASPLKGVLDTKLTISHPTSSLVTTAAPKAAASSASLITYGTECDSKNNSARKMSKNDLTKNEVDKKDAASEEKKKSKDICESVKEKSENTAINMDVTTIQDNVDEDDDNQVIPLWPSKSEAMSRAHTEFVQHKVYSLKDYSQVASPKTTHAQTMSASSLITSPPSGTSGAKTLLKSMSQDRKLKASAKRMSECPPSVDSQASLTSTGGVSATAASTAVAVGASKQIESSTHQVGAQASFPIGSSSGTSVPPLLQPASRHAALMSESRIDRMRKLFVSPLSLRSSTSKASSSQRLSFQSGASMLNKPQYLMHAMYRTGAGGAHHSRRSPIRPKQGKSFRVYGCPLQMANNIYPITCFGRADIYKQQAVPYVLARLCNYIEENSSQLTHEGIFRVSGNARLMEKLRTLFDRLGDAPLESESVDVATSASMLKMYLRELPEPLIPTRMNYYFIALAKKYSLFLSKDNISSSYSLSAHQGSSGKVTNITSLSSTSIADASSVSNLGDIQTNFERQRLAFARDLTKLLRKLPIENYNLLKYLACFLYRISLKQQYNKMCAEALGIVFGPNIFRIRSESYKGLKEQELSNQIMASIISNYKSIFDSEITDPLGNLIGSEGSELIQKISDEGAKVTSDQSASSNTTKPPIIALPQLTVVAALEGDTILNSKVGGISKAHSESSEAPGVKTVNKCTADKPEKVRSCCPKHCPGYLFDEDADDEEGDVDDEDAKGSEEDSESDMKLGDDMESAIDDEDEDEEDVNVDDDDCDDEGESYTPSTGSGSYCSSINSETLESSYEEEEAPPRAENVDVGSRSNISSSECASNTSYTPTSSHTDSDLHEEGIEGSFYGNSSSFESSPSFTRQQINRETSGSKQRQESKLVQPPPCLVCKRRQSCQLENTPQNVLTNQIKLDDKRHVEQSCDMVAQKFEEEPKTKEEITDIPVMELASEHIELFKSEEKSTPSILSHQEQKNTHGCQQQLHPPSTRSSSKRKKAEAARKLHSTAEQPISTEANSSKVATSVALSEKRGAENSSAYSAKKTSHLTTKSRCQESTSKVRHTASKATQHGARFDFFRRRSSSASSLTRIKHKRDQITGSTVNAHKKNQKPESSQHSRGRGAYQSSEMRQQRKLNEMRGHGSARRSRGKSHILRRGVESEAAHLAPSCGTSAARSAIRHSSVRYRNENSKSTGSRSQHGHKLENYYYYDPLAFNRISGLNLASGRLVENVDIGDEYIGCEFVSAQYLAEELEYTDRYFLLRSFNSDETLLRSLNYNSEFPQEVKNTHNRRRFSGHDFDKVGVVQLCTTPACDQIYEGLEEEIGSEILEDLINQNHPNLIEKDSSKVVQVEDQFKNISVREQAPGCSSQLSQFETVDHFFRTSFVSLLDNKLSGFRRSELSIDDSINHGSEDPILIYMKALKGLIKILKKYLKAGSNTGYSSEMKKLLSESFSSSNSHIDDWSTSHVDYLSAKSLTDHLEKLDSNSTESVDDKQDQLNDILQTKISILRERFNDLKNIRDHYIDNHRFYHSQHHRHRKQISKELSSTTDAKSKMHGSLDTLRQTKAHSLKLNTSSENRKSSVTSQETTETAATTSNKVSSVPDCRKPDLETDKPEENPKSEQHQLVLDSSPSSSNAHVNIQVRSYCKLGYFCPVEFVFNIEKQLAMKRAKGCRLVKLNDMDVEQLQSEKLELQKNLLRYEHCYGRPFTKHEYSLIGHLYERYRVVKSIKTRKQEDGRKRKNAIEGENKQE